MSLPKIGFAVYSSAMEPALWVSLIVARSLVLTALILKQRTKASSFLLLLSMQGVNCFLLHMLLWILRTLRIGFGCLNYCAELLKKMLRNFFNQGYSPDLLY